MMEKRKNTEGKIYKPEGSQYWFIFTAIVAYVAAMLFMSLFAFENSESTLGFSCIIVPFFSFILYGFFVRIQQTSIMVHEDGLEYRRGSGIFYVKWEDMKYLGRLTSGKSTSLGLYLHRTIEPNIQGSFDAFYFSKEINYIPLSQIVPVPTVRTLSGIDLEQFAETEFGAELKHYAPHLFEKDKR